jgi:hypothetical protein
MSIACKNKEAVSKDLRPFSPANNIFSASFLRKKQSFFLKNDALKEFLWAS